MVADAYGEKWVPSRIDIRKYLETAKYIVPLTDNDNHNDIVNEIVSMYVDKCAGIDIHTENNNGFHITYIEINGVAI